MGPGVGGIKVCEEYNPPDKDRFKLDNERDEEDAIDLVNDHVKEILETIPEGVFNDK